MAPHAARTMSVFLTALSSDLIALCFSWAPQGKSSLSNATNRAVPRYMHFLEWKSAALAFPWNAIAAARKAVAIAERIT
jgi:hypothetical protein